jgi:hypothetical protein
MTALDPRVMLRIDTDRSNDLIVDHSGQPADYTHTDGTIWTWLGRWHILGDLHLRSYDLRAPDGANALDVDVNLLPDLRGRKVVRFRPTSS